VIAGTIGDELEIEEEGEIDGIFLVGGVDEIMAIGMIILLVGGVGEVMAVGMIILLVGVVGEVMAMEVIFSVGEVGEGRMVEDVIGEGVIGGLIIGVSFCVVLDEQKEKTEGTRVLTGSGKGGSFCAVILEGIREASFSWARKELS
jgi:hypothetical protein